jgi:hypothetical protein
VKVPNVPTYPFTSKSFFIFSSFSEKKGKENVRMDAMDEESFLPVHSYIQSIPTFSPPPKTRAAPSLAPLDK